MVLEEEFYPHGGYQNQGYGLDYYSKNGYGGGHKVDYYSSDNTSSMQMVRPNIITPEPPKHFVHGNESHHHHKETSSGGYGGGGGHHHGFSGGAHHGGAGGGGGHMHHGGYGSFGQQMHGYPNKPTSPFLGGGGGGMHHNHHHQGGGGASATGNYEYESEHGSYMQKIPGKYESMSYDYYGEGRNRCPTMAPAISPYYGPAHHHNNNNNKNHHWAAAKGVSDDAEWVSKGL